MSALPATISKIPTISRPEIFEFCSKLNRLIINKPMKTPKTTIAYEPDKLADDFNTLIH